MLTRLKYIFLLIVILLFSLSNAQTKSPLSFQKRLSGAKADSSKARILNEWAWEIRFNNPDSSILLSTKGLEVSRKINWQFGIALSYHQLGEFNWRKSNLQNSEEYYNNALGLWDEIEKKGDYPVKSIKNRISATTGNLGIVFMQKNEFSKAMEQYSRALELDEELNNEKGISRHLSNMGSVCLDLGNYAQGLDYILRSLKITEKLGIKQDIANSYASVGNVYYYMADYRRALSHYRKALKMQEELGNKNGIAFNLGYIGNIYLSTHDKRAEEYYTKALKISREIGNKPLVTAWIGNLGSYYIETQQFDKALKTSFEAAEMGKETGDIGAVGFNYGNVGAIYTKTKKYTEAKKYLDRALTIADSLGDLALAKDEFLATSNFYAATGQYKDAYLNFVRHSALKDSLLNEEKRKEITRKDLNYEFEKKEAELKTEQGKREAIAAGENTRKNVIIWSIALGLMIVIGFSVFLYKRFRITERQKKIIEKQKHVVEEKNKEVLDSITYAKRLQVAVLPDKEDVDSLLDNYFILFKPRDIVSGDFYFIEPIRTNDGRNLVAVAVADCTGHGVPGAFMSMLGYDILKNSLSERNVNTASEALNYLNNRLTKTLRSTSKNQQVRDGMDIAFCVFYKETMMLYFSGANNSCWIIKKDKSFIELKGDKQPIGYFENSSPFTLQSVKLEQGDSFYVFSDGYPDQFGGPKGKKFKYKKLKDILTEIQHLDMNDQKEILEKTFNEWKGPLEQVDDVCIVGVKV